MVTSRQRVSTLLSGQLPDRPPMYDVLRNDAVIEHFSGSTLTPETARDSVIRAHVAALDATKPFYKLPTFDTGRVVTPSGRGVTRQRWTAWTEPAVYASPQEYERVKTESTAGPWDWTDDEQAALEESTRRWADLSEESGDIVRGYLYGGPARLDGIFTEVGLEAFSYYLADCPDVIHRQIEHRFEKIAQAVEHSDLPEGVLWISESCDIAFKSTLLFPPAFLRRSFIPGYRRFCDAVHRKGRKVLFHSDGNLWEILDDLVKAGVDLLHPVEPLAGMDPAELHRRYPELMLCGTIDVSQLLPFGTPQEIRDQVVRNIEATEGRIMVGSSTELHDEVPLENFLALHESVLDYAY